MIECKDGTRFNAILTVASGDMVGGTGGAVCVSCHLVIHSNALVAVCVCYLYLRCCDVCVRVCVCVCIITGSMGSPHPY